MCISDNNLQCVPRDNLTKRQKNLCNEQLAINRDVICSVLASCLSNFEKPVKCLEGIGVCGTNGMLWEKYFGEDVDVTVNGTYEEDFNLITKNLDSNRLKGKAVREDPCILLRKNSYDFIYLNCKTNASRYFDSVFSHIRENAVLIVTTSEDSSLYWQSAEIALRNYGGVIGKTSYHREVSVRLVIAEMARAAARYHKGLIVECTVVYKPQQSFTIVAKVKKGINEANNCIQNIKKLAHCNLCEDRNFISNSIFLSKIKANLSCNCSNESEGKVVMGIGPLWSGNIFNVEFIEALIKTLEGFPWKPRIYSLLALILEEARYENLSSNPSNVAIHYANALLNQFMDNPLKAWKYLCNLKISIRCFGGSSDIPPPKKIKKNDLALPYFYINTHRHSAKKFKLQKLSEIVKLLQESGYRASRTHFDCEAVRTNASVIEYVQILRESFNT